MKWEVDQMGIDEVGIDKVGIDEVGRYHIMNVCIYAMRSSNEPNLTVD